MDNSHLLPPNATELERAVATQTQRVEQIPVPLEKIWDAETVPAETLPFLAFAWSVDEWNDNWPESAQREVIKQSIRVHQRKGTLGAIKRALAAMQYSAEVTEWFEQVPPGQPGTFRIGVNPTNGTFYDTLAQLRQAIDSVKRLSAHYDIYFGTTVQCRASAVGASLVGVEITVMS